MAKLSRKRKRCDTPAVPLPAELLDTVIHLACQSTAGALGSADNIDYRTTLSIALVSRQLYNSVVPLLYTHVRLTKPSDLVFYARTAATRPDLTKLTKSLWMGPDENHMEARDHWPLNTQGTGMRSSITDPEKLPIGVKIGTCWSFAPGLPVGLEEWIVEAARDVIRQAARTVGEPEHPFFGRGVSLRCGGAVSFDGKEFRYTEGRIRVYQVQQRLDLFLEGVRKRQDLASLARSVSHTALDKGCNLPKQGDQKPVAHLNALPQAAWHTCSARSPLRVHDAFDRFDHPMVYMRSPPYRSTNDWEIVKGGVGCHLEYSIVMFQTAEEYRASEGTDSSEYSESSDKDDSSDNRSSSTACDSADERLSGSDGEASESEPEALFSSDNIGDWCLRLLEITHAEVDLGEPCVGALQILARIILLRSPRVICLALTSYMQQIASGYEYGPVVKRLHLLALGPPGQGYEGLMLFGYTGLASIRRLRLWSPGPHEVLARTIDEANALPALESLECTWTAPWVRPDEDGTREFLTFASETRTVCAVERLLGLGIGTRRKKPFQLTVMAHRRRIGEFYDRASEALQNHPRLELKRLPIGLEDGGGREHRSRKRALAHIRQQWEEETREILDLV